MPGACVAVDGGLRTKTVCRYHSVGGGWLEVEKKGIEIELRNFFSSPKVSEAENEIFLRLRKRLAKDLNINSIRVSRAKIQNALFDSLEKGASLKDEISLYSK